MRESSSSVSVPLWRRSYRAALRARAALGDISFTAKARTHAKSKNLTSENAFTKKIIIAGTSFFTMKFELDDGKKHTDMYMIKFITKRHEL